MQAEHFASTARSCGVSRIAYLGGLPVIRPFHGVVLSGMQGNIARAAQGAQASDMRLNRGLSWRCGRPFE